MALLQILNCEYDTPPESKADYLVITVAKDDNITRNETKLNPLQEATSTNSTSRFVCGRDENGNEWNNLVNSSSQQATNSSVNYISLVNTHNVNQAFIKSCKDIPTNRGNWLTAPQCI